MKPRVIALSLGGLVVVAVLWLTVSALSPGIPVDTANVEKGLIREFVDERAVTRLPQTHLITMPLTGRIEAADLIKLTEGTRVAKDQIVARIVASDLQSEVDRATARVERLEASIRENANIAVETTGLKQTEQFVESMKATVASARERVRAGKARFDYAVHDLERVSQLHRNNIQTEDELERAKLRWVEGDVNYQQDQLVEAAMKAMQAATDLMPTMVRQFIDRKQLTEDVLAKEKLEADAHLRQVLQEQQRGTMRSPVDGVVLARHVSNERFLTAGTTLLEIGRLEDLEVEADILSLDVVEAEIGAPVEIYGPAIGLPVAKGTVKNIYPAGFTKVSSLGVEQQRIKVIIAFAPASLARLLAERRLAVGYRVRARIITAEKPSALIVPRSALFRGLDGQWQVYAVRGSRVQLQQVEVGLQNDNLAEITKGLQAGETVVLAPESNLTRGMRVSPTVH